MECKSSETTHIISPISPTCSRSFSRAASSRTRIPIKRFSVHESNTTNYSTLLSSEFDVAATANILSRETVVVELAHVAPNKNCS